MSQSSIIAATRDLDAWARRKVDSSTDRGHAVLVKNIVFSVSDKAIALLRQGADQRGNVAYNTAKTAYLGCSFEYTSSALLIIDEINRLRDKFTDLIYLTASDTEEDIES